MDVAAADPPGVVQELETVSEYGLGVLKDSAYSAPN
jgi:hypothetical protein